MKEYDYKSIEKKWQDKWDKDNTFKATDDFNKKKFYGLVEFPYPSGQGLHVGHPRSYTALDIVCRKKRLEGYNVLFPMGWDAFGLPTENYAIKNKIPPKDVTRDNVANFKRQLKMLGFSFDWTREINTTDPAYYKWTQWIFLKLFEKGLAYKKEMPINFCTSCKVGLANEEVVNGVCERCGSEVVQKVKSQWMLKITEYAQRLIDDLDDLDYIEKVKIQQKNWIGRSEGAEVKFKISPINEDVIVYTTRPDTLFGATYMVLSPEHPLIEKYQDKIENIIQVKEYQAQTSRKSEFERTELVKDKTGVELKGLTAINPITNNEIPIWISDYVLMSYGTGAIMAVPAHDDRDWDFATKFNLPIIQVIKPENNQQCDITKSAYTDVNSGVMINSGFLTGMQVKDAIKKMIEYVEQKGIGSKKVNFKLRDWVFSRQRYWGEPIPLVHCEKCGWVALNEKDLPLTLPEVENYEPTDNGESPLSKMEEWINTTCPKCGGHARRETDTMPQWAGSSWYFLRYIDPHNDDFLAAKEKLQYWLPIDWYNGGMEHTTLHLLYSRFWHKFLYDIGVVNTKEPYQKRTSQGMILGENSEKMSKSRGNVINPDDIINEYGADTLRMYEMFIGAFDQATPWSMQGVKGCYKFLERVWKMQEFVTDLNVYSPEMEKNMHKAIQKVTDDIEKMKFNTAIATLMSLSNEFYKINRITKREFETFLILLNPIAPHITEEIWENLGLESQIAYSKWPQFDKNKVVEDEMEIPVQINGKVKEVIKVEKEASENDVKEAVKNSEAIQKLLQDKTVVKEIYVKGKIYNIVVK